MHVPTFQRSLCSCQVSSDDAPAGKLIERRTGRFLHWTTTRVQFLFPHPSIEQPRARASRADASFWHPTCCCHDKEPRNVCLFRVKLLGRQGALACLRSSHAQPLFASRPPWTARLSVRLARRLLALAPPPCGAECKGGRPPPRSGRAGHAFSGGEQNNPPGRAWPAGLLLVGASE